MIMVETTATRKAKAGRSIEMSRGMWQMVANVAVMADTLGVTPPIAEKCRVLAARAKYYQGEPESKIGLVRGELPTEEWMAFRELVQKFANAPPALKALAQALGEAGIDQTMIVREKANPRKQDGLVQNDVETVCNPESLQFLLSVLERMVMLAGQTMPAMCKESEMALEKVTGVTAQQMWENTLANIQSARQKLEALLESFLNSGGSAPMSLLMSTVEARLVCSMLSTFKEAAYAAIPPDRAEEKKEIYRQLESAVRFFARMADGEGAVE